MKDLDLHTLNPNIRETVAWLRAHGFNTCDSGDGKTHEHDCDREYAYVTIQVAPEDMVNTARRLFALARSKGIDIHRVAESDTPCVQATYDPANDAAFVDLMFVDDDVLRAAEPPPCGYTFRWRVDAESGE